MMSKTREQIYYIKMISKRLVNHLGTDSCNPLYNLTNVKKELGEVYVLISSGKLFSSPEVEDELGDLLFTVMQTIIHTGRNPTTVLQKTIDKLQERVEAIKPATSIDEAEYLYLAHKEAEEKRK